MSWLGLDVGGARIKVADGFGYAASVRFPLWQRRGRLARALGTVFSASPPADCLAVTMTGELADCYPTKAEGVADILDAVHAAAAGRAIWVYGTDGRFLRRSEAIGDPMRVAASNWHALARFCCRFVTEQVGLLVDIGSTTSDLIPLVDGQPRSHGCTDPQRLVCGELVYTGVTRSPLCAIVAELPWRGQMCPTAQELFATTADAYLWLGALPQDRSIDGTADGRPLTRPFARDRLARMICADREMFDDADAVNAATAVRQAQLVQLQRAAQRVFDNLPGAPQTVVTSGVGEFLARELVRRLAPGARIVSLIEQIGRSASTAAPAHALAVLAREVDPA